MRPNFQPQFFPERLAFLEVLEELIESADDDGCFFILAKKNLEAESP